MKPIVIFTLLLSLSILVSLTSVSAEDDAGYIREARKAPKSAQLVKVRHAKKNATEGEPDFEVENNPPA